MIYVAASCSIGKRNGTYGPENGCVGLYGAREAANRVTWYTIFRGHGVSVSHMGPPRPGHMPLLEASKAVGEQSADTAYSVADVCALLELGDLV